MRPVEQRRHAGVDRLERAEVVPGVDVFGAVGGSELVEHDREVAAEAHIRGDAADDGLPGVTVGVDEPRDDDAIGGVDHLRVADVERRRDGGNAVVLDQEVTAEDVPERGIHRQHMATSQQRPPAHRFSSTLSSVTELTEQY